MIKWVGLKLFLPHDIHSFLARKTLELETEIYKLEPRLLLERPLEELESSLIEQVTMEVPVLEQPEAMEPKDAMVDLSNERGRDSGRTGRDSSSGYHQGTRQVVRLAFSGDPAFFQVTPSHFTTRTPVGEVVGSESALYLAFDHFEVTDEELKNVVTGAIDAVDRALKSLRDDVNEYHAALPNLIKGSLTNRREKMPKRIAKRWTYEASSCTGEAPSQLAFDWQRQREHAFRLSRPRPSSRRKASHRTRLRTKYEDILSVLQSMSLVFERSPEAFIKMGEEHIRFHFLVLLNGLYRGEASAETFNLGGKTDILISHQGRNLFIAECKDRDGPKTLTDAIRSALRVPDLARHQGRNPRFQS